MPDPTPIPLLEALRSLRRNLTDPGARLDVGHFPSLRLRGLPTLTFPSFETARDHAAPPAEDLESAPGEAQFSGENRARETTLLLRELTILGATGAAPRIYTERSIATRQRSLDPLAAFLDVLNHRSVEILARAAERYRPFLEAERAPDTSRPADTASGMIAALIGHFGPAANAQLGIPSSLARAYAAHFALGRATADSLVGCLEEALGTPVQIEQFQGRWLPVDEADQPRMGAILGGPTPPTVFPFLVGGAAWDVAHTFRIRLGPMSYEAFRRFLPTHPGFAIMVEFVRLMAGSEYDFDVQLCLEAGEVPPMVLGAPGDDAAASLGFDTWLGAPPQAEVIGDTVLSSEAHRRLSA